MKADIKYSKEELTQAFKLHYNIKYPVRSRLMLIFGLLILAIAVIMIIFNFPEKLIYLKYIALLAGIFYIGIFFYRRKQLFKRASNLKTFQGDFTFQLNNKGLSFGKEDKVSNCEWTKIIDVIKDEFNILFYFGKDNFYILPLKTLTSSQKTEVNELVSKYKN